ncbi:MAG: polysaccharide biosynthesis/export family protein [Caulobacterales bacterium]
MLRHLVFLFALAAVAACSTLPAASDPPPRTAVTSSVPANSYSLGAGDRVRVIVFGEEDLSGEFTVDGTGTLSVPLLGPIPAVGTTTRDLEARIVEGLRGRFLANPRVSVEVLTFRPFYILGEVNSPGEYPFADGLTVMNAVATAQGFTYRANQRHVMIRRAGSTTEERVRIDPSTSVRPGDTIRILERFF